MRKGRRDTGEWKTEHETSMCASSPERQMYPGLHKKHGQQTEGGDSPCLIRSCETPLGVLHAVLRSPVQARHGPVRVSPEEGHKNG